MDFQTCDLCDANEDLIARGIVRALPPVFRDYGGVLRFAGQVVTLRLFEDNGLVRTLLETPGHGRVLLIDGGASLRCALVGGNLGKLAEQNGWSGIVVHGCVRDSAELAACEVGVKALGTIPVRSIKRGGGLQDAVVQIDGVRVAPGEWLYADEDGVIVSSQPLIK